MQQGTVSWLLFSGALKTWIKYCGKGSDGKEERLLCITDYNFIIINEPLFNRQNVTDFQNKMAAAHAYHKDLNASDQFSFCFS